MVEWCQVNALKLNVIKCYLISFCRNDPLISFAYKITDVQISRVESTKDLEIYLDSKLNYICHIDYICAKTLKLLGFLRKFTADLNECFIIIHLYKTLELPILLYAASVWSSYLLCDIKKLESAQHKFLRYLAFKCGRLLHPFDHGYSFTTWRDF